MISILMSVYDEKESYIREAIESILSQSEKNFEFIIIIDKPDNELAKSVIDEYKHADQRIVVLYNKNNIGLARSLNEGLKIAKGKYIARMDSDDIALEDRLKREKDILDTYSEIDVVATDKIDIDEMGKVICKGHSTVNDNIFFIKAFHLTNVIAHSTVMIRKEALKTAGGYRSFNTSQDYDLWLRMLKRGSQFYIIKEPLMKYRIRNNSISGSNPARQRAHHQYALYLDSIEKVGQDLHSEKQQQKYFDRIR